MPTTNSNVKEVVLEEKGESTQVEQMVTEVTEEEEVASAGVEVIEEDMEEIEVEIEVAIVEVVMVTEATAQLTSRKT